VKQHDSLFFLIILHIYICIFSLFTVWKKLYNYFSRYLITNC